MEPCGTSHSGKYFSSRIRFITLVYSLGIAGAVGAFRVLQRQMASSCLQGLEFGRIFRCFAAISCSIELPLLFISQAWQRGAARDLAHLNLARRRLIGVARSEPMGREEA